MKLHGLIDPALCGLRNLSGKPRLEKFLSEIAYFKKDSNHVQSYMYML